MLKQLKGSGNMKKSILGISIGLIVIVAFSIFFYNPHKLIPDNPEGKSRFYTMIGNDDNGEKLGDNQRYKYTLEAFDESGKKKILTFNSSKQLRKGAYLELYVASFRGVTYWQEIQLNELPEPIKSKYSK
ncbi:YxeA family protein [Lysinibacillus irui]|uniref:YxeA family protein n=1 Tax=Lysinibacillus irui TaxID=2998077 RepID=A0ABU5NI28_9BACI|nr:MULTISPECIES: YxeA family protein [Lysinibacillus]MEA0553070.1 YxeA family protein [Lysinibacillus irui]MEA0562686.1 YxeA family protein [Lysinibacillus irui]MEA0975650.1 YxeA family protein [Lysinibacillus irui]MEA1041804.1 YxeA family protein [Lysinibacillus irui]